MAASVVLLVISAAADAGKRGLLRGFADPLFESAERNKWLATSRADGASLAKVFVSWRQVATSRPANPKNPGDPAYDFDRLDETVRAASNHGLRVVLGVQVAPAWAEGNGRSQNAPPGTWKPDPGEFEAFMIALATRYSGTFQGGSATLPRVADFQVWSEPNLHLYLTPQYRKNTPVAPNHYKRLLNAGTQGVRSVHADNRVVTAGLAPYGDRKGGNRTRPMVFWRKLFCLKRKRLKPKGNCAPKASFDVLAHHAINTSGPPRKGALHPDDVSSGNLPKVKRVMRAAERGNTVVGRRHKLWVTEFWWDSDPPSKSGYPLRKQARFVQETMYLAWKAGFSAAIQLRIRDVAGQVGPGVRKGDGLYFRDGRAKPSARAFAFPFVAEKKRKKKVRVWGIAAGSKRVKIEARSKGRWKRVGRLSPGSSGVYSGTVRTKGKKLRAVSSGRKSLPWRVR